MSNYLKSYSCFLRYKRYLDAVKSGVNEFAVENPKSFGRIIRGVLQGIRERGDTGYDDLLRYRVTTRDGLVKFVEKVPNQTIAKKFSPSSVYDMMVEINRLSELEGLVSCLFTINTLTDDDIETVTTMCNELKFDIDITPNTIKVTKGDSING